MIIFLCYALAPPGSNIYDIWWKSLTIWKQILDLDENDTNFSDISDSISNDSDMKNNNSDMEEKFEQISFKDFKKYQEIISKQK